MLSSHYPLTELHNKRNPLHESVFILLSSQTTESNYLQTWSNFRKYFPRIKDAYNAPVERIYQAIKSGGLGEWKSLRIWNLLHEVVNRYGRLSLSVLSPLDDLSLEKELSSLDGVGIKSARCIMMYSFDRDVFPSDTHVIRIVRRLGFHMPTSHVKSRAFADGMQDQVPTGLRHRFHVNLIQHGRAICRPKPQCTICPVRNHCRSGAN